MPAVITDNANYDASALLNLQASTSMAGTPVRKEKGQPTSIIKA